MGHVNGLQKYECVIWKVCMSLSRIVDGSVWVVMDGRVGGWFTSWKWFDVSVDEGENFPGKILYRWGEGVFLDGFID